MFGDKKGKVSTSSFCFLLFVLGYYYQGFGSRWMSVELVCFVKTINFFLILVNCTQKLKAPG